MLYEFDIHELFLSFGTDVSRSYIRVDRWISFIDVEHGVFEAHCEILTAILNWMIVISNPNVGLGVNNIEWHDNRSGQLLFIALVKYLLQLFDHTKLRKTLE